MSVIIRLQNLPWAANASDIRDFFKGLSIPDGGVHIVGGEMGDAFIAFSTDEDARLAMQKNGTALKGIQITLLLSSRNEMQKVIENAQQQAMGISAYVPPPTTAPQVPSHSQYQSPSHTNLPSGQTPTPVNPPHTSNNQDTNQPSQNQQLRDAVSTSYVNSQHPMHSHAINPPPFIQYRPSHPFQVSQNQYQVPNRMIPPNQFPVEQMVSQYPPNLHQPPMHVGHATQGPFYPNDPTQRSQQPTSETTALANEAKPSNSPDNREVDNNGIQHTTNIQQRLNNENRNEKPALKNDTKQISTQKNRNVEDHLKDQSSNDSKKDKYNRRKERDNRDNKDDRRKRSASRSRSRSREYDRRRRRRSRSRSRDRDRNRRHRTRSRERDSKRNRDRTDRDRRQKDSRPGFSKDRNEQKSKNPIADTNMAATNIKNQNNKNVITNDKPKETSDKSSEIYDNDMMDLEEPESNSVSHQEPPPIVLQESNAVDDEPQRKNFNQKSDQFKPDLAQFNENDRGNFDNDMPMDSSNLADRNVNNEKLASSQSDVDRNNDFEGKHWNEQRNWDEKRHWNEKRHWDDQKNRYDQDDNWSDRFGERHEGRFPATSTGYGNKGEMNESAQWDDQHGRHQDGPNYFDREGPAFRGSGDRRGTFSRGHLSHRNYRGGEFESNSYDTGGYRGRGAPRGHRGGPPIRRESGRTTCVEVNYIPPRTSYRTLRDYFEGLYLPNDSIKLLGDDNGQFVGKAQIRFTCTRDAYEATRFDGKPLYNSKLMIRYLDEETYDRSVDVNVMKYNYANQQPARCMYVSGIPFGCIEDDVANVFENYKIVDLVLERERGSCVLTGGAFVLFSSPDEAQHVFRNLAPRASINGTSLKFEICPESHMEYSARERDRTTKESNKNKNEFGSKNIKSSPSSNTKSELVTNAVAIKNVSMEINQVNIRDFFSDIGLVPEKVYFDPKINDVNEPTRDVYVIFCNVLDARQALSKSGQSLGRGSISVNLILLSDIAAEMDIPLEKLNSNTPQAEDNTDNVNTDEFNLNSNSKSNNSKPKFPDKEKTPLLPMPDTKPAELMSLTTNDLGPYTKKRGIFNERPSDHFSTVMPNQFGLPGCVIALGNIPYQASIAEILEFMQNIFPNLQGSDIIRRYDEFNKPTADARVSLPSQEAAKMAVQMLNRKYIHNRPIFISII